MCSPPEWVHDLSKGGPGLSGYAYKADMYCVECGRELLRNLLRTKIPNVLDLDDSEVLPCPVFFGESDYPQHCANCGKYLYGEEDWEEE